MNLSLVTKETCLTSTRQKAHAGGRNHKFFQSRTPSPAKSVNNFQSVSLALGTHALQHTHTRVGTHMHTLRPHAQSPMPGAPDEPQVPGVSAPSPASPASQGPLLPAPALALLQPPSPPRKDTLPLAHSHAAGRVPSPGLPGQSPGPASGPPHGLLVLRPQVLKPSPGALRTAGEWKRVPCLP